jgi:flagellar hook-basal body complex protein FliE
MAMDISGTTAAPIVVTPRGVTAQDAARAYRDTDDGSVGGAEGASGGDFGGLLSRAVESAVQTGQHAETAAMQAIAGGGNLTDVVQALSRAELALQTTTAIRDRVVQAYQDIMKMPM